MRQGINETCHIESDGTSPVRDTCKELLNDFRADLISFSEATEDEIRDGAVRSGCGIE